MTQVTVGSEMYCVASASNGVSYAALKDIIGDEVVDYDTMPVLEQNCKV